jgi:hypothetical protein
MMRGGGIYNHIETENTKGEIINDSGRRLGWQDETGVSNAVGRRLNLVPSIRYRTLSRDINIENTSTSVYLGLD